MYYPKDKTFEMVNILFFIFLKKVWSNQYETIYETSSAPTRPWRLALYWFDFHNKFPLIKNFWLRGRIYKKVAWIRSNKVNPYTTNLLSFKQKDILLNKARWPKAHWQDYSNHWGKWPYNKQFENGENPAYRCRNSASHNLC